MTCYKNSIRFDSDLPGQRRAQASESDRRGFGPVQVSSVLISVFIGSLGLQGREIVRGDFSAQRGTREVSPLQRVHVAFGERGDSPPGETPK